MKCCSRCGTQCEDNEKVCHNCLHSLKVIQNSNNKNEQESVDDESYKDGFYLGFFGNFTTRKLMKKYCNKRTKEGAKDGYRFALNIVFIIGLIYLIYLIYYFISFCKDIINS